MHLSSRRSPGVASPAAPKTGLGLRLASLALGSRLVSLAHLGRLSAREGQNDTNVGARRRVALLPQGCQAGSVPPIGGSISRLLHGWVGRKEREASSAAWHPPPRRTALPSTTRGKGTAIKSSAFTPQSSPGGVSLGSRFPALSFSLSFLLFPFCLRRWMQQKRGMQHCGKGP